MASGVPVQVQLVMVHWLLADRSDALANKVVKHTSLEYDREVGRHDSSL